MAFYSDVKVVELPFFLCLLSKLMPRSTEEIRLIDISDFSADDLYGTHHECHWLRVHYVSLIRLKLCRIRFGNVTLTDPSASIEDRDLVSATSARLAASILVLHNRVAAIDNLLNRCGEAIQELLRVGELGVRQHFRREVTYPVDAGHEYCPLDEAEVNLYRQWILSDKSTQTTADPVAADGVGVNPDVGSRSDGSRSCCIIL